MKKWMISLLCGAVLLTGCGQKEETEPTSSEVGLSVQSTKITFEVPEGFGQYEKEETVWRLPEEQADGSNITLSELEEDWDHIDETSIQTQLEAAKDEKGVAPQNVKVQPLVVDETQKIFETHYTLGDEQIAQVLSYRKADAQSYAVVFTDVHGGSWMDAFREAAKTIKSE